MNKVKANASWNELSPAQRQALEDWLFEDRLSYSETLKRARKQLGYQGSRTSLQRFYERTAQERTLDLFADANSLADAVDGIEVSTERLQRSGMKVVAQAFIRQVSADPDNVKQWGFLAKLLLHSEENQLRREMQREDSEIRREQLSFSKLKYQYDVMGNALKALPELEKVAEAQEEASLTELERNKRYNDMRRRMWGEVIPDLLPETEEELAHPEIIKQRFEEMIKRPIVMRKDGTWEYSKVPIQQPVQPPPSLASRVAPPPDDDPNEPAEEEPGPPVPADPKPRQEGRASTPCAPQSPKDADEPSADESPAESDQGRAGTPCTPPEEDEELPAEEPPAETEQGRAGTPCTPQPANSPAEATQPTPEPEPQPWEDAPRRRTKEERDAEYHELMRRARQMRYR